MNQSALIWTLTMLLTVMCALLGVDFISHWRRDRAAGKTASHVKKKREQREKIDAVSGMKCMPTHAATRQVSKLDTDGNAGIDLMGAKRPSFYVKLPPDGKILHLWTPTKAVSDQFQAVGRLLEDAERGSLSGDGEQQLFKLTAVILSHNQERTTYTAADVATRMSSRDVAALLEGYMNWLLALIKQKN